ncbi:MAG: hypothetical protein Alpg2KO_28330 [Alphaproteobacteria bacterium]
MSDNPPDNDQKPVPDSGAEDTPSAQQQTDPGEDAQDSSEFPAVYRSDDPFRMEDRQILWQEAEATTLAGYVWIAGVVGLMVVILATPVGQWILNGTGDMVDELLSLGKPEVVRVDGAQPAILRTGQSVTLEVVFARQVTVTGQPTLQLDVGGKTREMRYTGQLSPGRLRFAWRVGAQDVDLDGIGWPTQIDTRNGKITDENGRGALTSLPLNYHQNARVILGAPTMLSFHRGGGVGHLVRGQPGLFYDRHTLPDIRITDVALLPASQQDSRIPQLWASLADGRVLRSTDLSSFTFPGRSTGPLTSIVRPEPGGRLTAGGAGNVYVLDTDNAEDQGQTIALPQSNALIRGMASDGKGTLVAVSEQGHWFRALNEASLITIGDVGRPGFHGIIWHNGAFHAISGRQVRESADGLSWSATPVSSQLRGQLRHIAGSSGLMAVGSSAGEVLIRPDGATNWRMLPELPESARLTALTVLPGRRVLAATAQPTGLLELSAARFDEGWRPIALPDDAPPIEAMLPVIP